MFNRIRIKGFRSCKDVTLDRLGHMTALVGRNGAGKTNILRAINWLGRATTARDPTPIFQGWPKGWPSGPTPVNVESEIILNKIVYRFVFHLKFEQDKTLGRTMSLRETLHVQATPPKWQNLVERDGTTVRLTEHAEEIEVNPAVPCLPILATNFSANPVIKQHIQPLLQFFSATRYYPVDVASQPSYEESPPFILDNHYQQWLAHYRASGNPSGPLPIRLLYALLERPEQAAEIRSQTGVSGLGLLESLDYDVTQLSGKSVAGRSDQDGANIYQIIFRPGPQLGSGKDILTYADLSLGTRRVLSIVTSLVLDDSAVLLLEHPEDGIHSGLLKKLISLLRTNADPAQIILSSHSENVLNRLDPKDIRLVTIDRGATIARQLTEHEVYRAVKFIAEEGTLGEFVETLQEE